MSGLNLVATLFAAATLTACASTTVAARPGPLLVAGPPPTGYLDYCARQAADCAGSEEAASDVQARALAMLANTSSSAALEPAAALSFNSATVAQPQWAQLFLAAKSADHALAIGRSEFPATRADVLNADPSVMKTIRKVNERVNRSVRERSDLEQYGAMDYWRRPIGDAQGAFGDCEDYALEKRHLLIEAGLPREALSLAVVQTRDGQIHAVLLVATSKGEYVLDNLTPWVGPWEKSGYILRTRQVAGSPFDWALPAQALAALH